MITLVAGPPCAGKSTWARENATGEIIDYDAIAAEMGSPGWDHPPGVRAAVRHEIERRLNALGGDAIVIRSVPDAREREALAQRIGADRVIVLAVPADEAKRRARRDGRPEWTAEAIDRWWARYSPSPIDTPLEAIVADDATTMPEDAPEATEETTDETAENSETAGAGETAEEPFDAERAREMSRKKNAEIKKLKAKIAELEAALKTAPEANKEGAPENSDLAERLRKVESERDGHAREVARLRVALRRGLTEAQAKRLVGNTEEELEADADELLSTFSVRAPVTRPVESLRGGSVPNGEPDETDPAKLAARIRRGRF